MKKQTKKHDSEKVVRFLLSDKKTPEQVSDYAQYCIYVMSALVAQYNGPKELERLYRNIKKELK
jgi:hypothetical protein